MSPESLKSYTRKMLTDLARSRGLGGWHSMTKAELVGALAVKSARNTTAAASRKRSSEKVKSKTTQVPPPNGHVRNGHVPTQPASNGHRGRVNGAAAKEAAKRGKTNGAKSASANHNPPARMSRMLAPAADVAPEAKDRFVAMVRDPYWLHAYWELNRATIRRAEVGLRAEWHSAVPVLRLLDVSDADQTRTSEAHVRDIQIHGGVNHWYIPVDGRPRSYKLQIGYLTPGGRFFVLARSNIVSTPDPAAPSEVDGNWHHLEQNCQRVFALSGGFAEGAADSPLRELFQERLRRSMGQIGEAYGGCLAPQQARAGLALNLQAELVVYGTTQPRAQLTMQGDHVTLREDGSFMVRMSLQEGRQLIPAVVISADGMEQRTVVLSVDRNTKELEPQSLQDS